MSRDFTLHRFRLGHNLLFYLRSARADVTHPGCGCLWKANIGLQAADPTSNIDLEISFRMDLAIVGEAV
jgi:hypothetical protein